VSIITGAYCGRGVSGVPGVGCGAEELGVCGACGMPPPSAKPGLERRSMPPSLTPPKTQALLAPRRRWIDH
jgi:hypothetical protein